MLPTSPPDLCKKTTFATPEQEALLSVVWTAGLLSDAVERLLTPFAITPAQFNVLRILRGAGPGGLGRNEIRDRLLSRMPDVTRLLERMEAAGLVTRERDASDRRCVPTRITEKALGLLRELDPIIEAEHRRLFGHLPEAELRALIGALASVRARI